MTCEQHAREKIDLLLAQGLITRDFIEPRVENYVELLQQQRQSIV